MTLTSTTEAERLECGPEHIGDEISSALDDLAAAGNALEAAGVVSNLLERARTTLTALIPLTHYLPIPAASAAELSRMMTAHNTALLALRTSEEARVKAERERDEAMARLPVEDECEDIRNRAEAAETALADMRKERDASDALFIELCEKVFGRDFTSEECELYSYTTEHYYNVWERMKTECEAARSRARPDGEEKL